MAQGKRGSGKDVCCGGAWGEKDSMGGMSHGGGETGGYPGALSAGKGGRCEETS